jgi:hypothetical protein
MNKQIKVTAEKEAFEPQMSKAHALEAIKTLKQAKALREVIGPIAMQHLEDLESATDSLTFCMAELMPLDYHDVVSWSRSAYEASDAIASVPKDFDSDHLPSYRKYLRANLMLEGELSEGYRSDFRYADQRLFCRTSNAFQRTFNISLTKWQADHFDHYGIDREGFEVAT